MARPALDPKKAFGPLRSLITDPNVFEICVDGPHEIYYSTREGLVNSKKLFKGESDLMKVINDLIKASKKKLSEDERAFYIQPDPSINIFITLPPVTLNGPTMNIIKMPEKKVTLQDLVKFGALEDEGLKLLTDLVKKDASILVGGITGSGKTTLLNCLVDTIPAHYRVVTVEKRFDLILNRQARTVRMIASLQSNKAVDLVRQAQDMRPDYLICSYIEQEEAWEFTKILRDGYSGMACITAEDVFDCIKRLELMVFSSNPHFSLENVRYAIGQAFKYIVFQKRENQKRFISDIAELLYEDGELKLKSLYKR